MRRLLGWMCYRVVMTWPGAWPSGAAAAWILAWAGDYANETPNAKSQAPGAALSRQVACTDGLGAAVPPAPTFDQGENDERD